MFGAVVVTVEVVCAVPSPQLTSTLKVPTAGEEKLPRVKSFDAPSTAVWSLFASFTVSDPLLTVIVTVVMLLSALLVLRAK